MCLRTAIITFCLVAVLGVPTLAQQDPNDLGNADSMFFVLSPLDAAGNDSTLVADLYIYNDAQDVITATCGFSWENPNLVMDSAIATPLAVSSFNLLQMLFYANNIDSTNVRQQFQFAGSRMFGNGLLQNAAPQHVATYWFHLNDWTVNDSVCFPYTPFSGGAVLKFVDVSLVSYIPIYETPCVFDPNQPQLGTLQVDPVSLTFEAEVGGSAPATRTFNVSEVGGAAIPYIASSADPWIVLTNPEGTTDGTVTVGVDLAGLAAGTHNGTAVTTSTGAGNAPEVAISLILTEPNHPPELAAIGDREIDENQMLQFTVSATDIDGTIPTLSAAPLPDGAVFINNGDGSGTFGWTPTYDQAALYDITFTASDGELTDEETITITVHNVNRTPMLDDIPDQIVVELENLNFGVSAVDPDGNYPNLSTGTLPDGATFVDDMDGTGTFDWTPVNTQAGIYTVTFIASDGSLADSASVLVQVLDSDRLIINPDTLDFVAEVGSSILDPQFFSVTVSDGSAAPVAASEESAWITLQSGTETGTTPHDIYVQVNISGLAAGVHFDSVLVIDEREDPLDPAYAYVRLTLNEPPKVLVVEPDSIGFFRYDADADTLMASFFVSEETAAAISYSISTEADWIVLSDPTGVTPDSVVFMVNYHSLVPGSYYDSIMVSSEEAGNSPQFVHVSLVVWPCPVLTVEDSEFNFTIFEGETVSLGDSVMLTSSGPSEIYWVATNPGYFIASPSEGTTPSSTFLTYERTFETFGTYADTLVFAGSNPSDTAWPCLPETMAIVNVNVVRLPSADTIIVVSTPAVPGMRLEVPVLFSNSCPLEGMSLVLAWDNEEIHLDSVSFVGSAVEYMDSKGAYETVYNNMDQVSIYANVDEPPLVPVGSQQLFATMHFALSCEIEDGAYEFVLGEDSAMPSIAFIRDCGEGPEVEIPGYIPGSTIVGTATNFVCGYVVDPDMNEIEGATVELWDDYPTGAILMTTTSSSIGSFAFDDITTIPFDLYAYKDGYYPGKIENNNFGDKGGIIILEPVQELIETISWVDYGCPAEGNTYFGAPVPVGSVVEAFTPDSLLVGQFTVTLAGSYGYMPVYRASSELGDDGVVAGETIWFTINGLQAVAYGNTVYPTENIEVQVCLEVRGEVLKECDLVGGWNLISWNVDTESDDIAEVLSPIMGSVEVVRGFEQGGLTYDPDLPEFSTLWDVDHLSGYLVRIDPDVDLITLEVTGLPVPETTPIALTARWNLVSYLPEVDMATSSALGPILDNLVVAVGFDPVTGIAIYRPDGGEFNTLETMSTCSGYWLKVVENDVLTYPGTFGGTAIAAEGMPVKNRVVTTPGIDQASISTTNWIDLYSRNLTVDGHLVEAGTTITAHAADDNSLIGSFTLTTHGKFGFMPVYADDAGEETTGMLPGDNFYLKVGETRTTDDFVWSTNGDCVEVVALSTGGTDTDNVPISYSLDQNYPNPFNPTTTISFSLPNTGTAKIEVFNVLGRLIATPFDGEASSGENQVVWNGRDQNGSAVASGVYFYRLSADNYTETRKMMLLK